LGSLLVPEPESIPEVLPSLALPIVVLAPVVPALVPALVVLLLPPVPADVASVPSELPWDPIPVSPVVSSRPSPEHPASVRAIAAIS
jgi:hypothetical protein